jgi:hypothetical protein
VNRKVLAKYPGQTLGQTIRDQYLLHLKRKIVQSWQQRRTLTTEVGQELPCYPERAPRFHPGGLIEKDHLGCNHRQHAVRCRYRALARLYPNTRRMATLKHVQDRRVLLETRHAAGAPDDAAKALGLFNLKTAARKSRASSSCPQNTSFIASCIIRGSRAADTLPKVAFPKPGWPNE